MTLKDTCTLVAIFIAIVIIFIVYDKKEDNKSYYNDTIVLDSIDNVILNLKQTIEYNERLIDSLTKIKQKTIIKYEKEISDFNDASVVSDDSITRYIRSKIENL